MTAVDEIKARLDIVDLVSETVKLRRSGRSYTGFCPFHPNSHTPAFAVFPDSGTWRCFAHMVLPISKPILGASAALSFADSWNMVEQPLIYLSNDQGAMPLSVMFNQLSTGEQGIAFAGAALYILPALLIYTYFQEDILLGIQLSDMK